LRSFFFAMLTNNPVSQTDLSFLFSAARQILWPDFLFQSLSHTFGKRQHGTGIEYKNTPVLRQYANYTLPKN